MHRSSRWPSLLLICSLASGLVGQETRLAGRCVVAQRIDGKLVATEQPISGALVRVVSLRGPEGQVLPISDASAETRSDGKGEFVLADIPPNATVSLALIHRDYYCRRTELGRRAPLESGRVRTRWEADTAKLSERRIPPDASRSEILLAAEPGVVLVGRVLNHQGDPLAGATVRTSPQSDHQILETLTDEAGQFRVGAMRPRSKIRIFVELEGYRRHRIVHPRVKQAGRQSIEIQLQREAKISVQLKLPLGEPHSRFSVVAEHENGDFSDYESARPDEKGQATLRSLEPGARYRLIVKDRRDGTQRLEGPWVVAEREAPLVHLVIPDF